MTGQKFWQARGFVVSGVFLLTLTVLAAVTLTGHSSPSRKLGRAPARVAADGCPRTTGDQRVPLRAPAAHWDRVGQERAPGSTLAGPARVTGHVRTCYAHSPTGAVFAAYGYFVAQSEYPGDVAMLRALTAAGRVRDEALRRGGSPPPDPSWTVALVGFRVQDYAPGAATVTLAALAAPAGNAVTTGQSGSRMAAVPVRLRWEDRDWKVAVDQGGFEPELIDSLAGLVPWSAP